jgi:hypothetical protein
MGYGKIQLLDTHYTKEPLGQERCYLGINATVEKHAHAFCCNHKR